MVAELDSLTTRVGIKGRYERNPRRTNKGNAAPAVEYYLGKDISQEILTWFGDDIHRIPRRLIEGCNREQLESLWQGLMDGDGTANASGYWCFYAGLNSGLADDVQEIGLRLGISTVKKLVPQSGQWIVLISKRTQHYIRGPKRAQYFGLVWDITVPSGAFVARRRGKIFVTGNCPENVRGEGAELAGAVQRIVRQGRSFGLGTLLVDQRPQDVSKRCVTQCDTLICHQLIHKTDRDALRDWVRGYDTDGRGDEFLNSLPSLEPGEAWAWSPASKLFQKTRVNRRQTFDSGAAPDGTASSRAVQRAEVDLESLRGQLTEIVEKAKADDPRELRRQIAELQRQLNEKSAAKPVTVEMPAIGTADWDRLQKMCQGVCGPLNSLHDTLVHFQELIRQTAPGRNTDGQHASTLSRSAVKSRDVGLARHSNQSAVNQAIASVNQTGINRHKTGPSVNKSASTADSPQLGKAERAVLQALYWLQSDREIDESKIAFYAGYSPAASTVGVALSKIRKLGLAERFALTDAGLRAVPNPADAKPVGQQLREWMRPKLDLACNKVLDVLLAHPGQRFSYEEIADLTGYSREASTVGVALSRLKKVEAAEGGIRDGGTKAADVFFE